MAATRSGRERNLSPDLKAKSLVEALSIEHQVDDGDWLIRGIAEACSLHAWTHAGELRG